jgi:hypothetical protein
MNKRKNTVSAREELMCTWWSQAIILTAAVIYIGKEIERHSDEKFRKKIRKMLGKDD